MILNHIHTVYFLGIGGIGMSALARYFLTQGKVVKGYDRTCTPLTEALEAEGAEVVYDDLAELVPYTIDLCIYTPAIPATHSAWDVLKEHHIPMKKRAEVLGMISREIPTLAVAGTHGKTTTSAMVAHIVQSVQGCVDAFVGGVMTNYQSNFLFDAQAKFAVVEADEYDRSFLQLSPQGSIVTNTDADHLDIYGTADTLTQEFQSYANLVNDVLVVHESVKLTSEKRMISYGLNIGDYQLQTPTIQNGRQFITIKKENEVLAQFEFILPGIHNALNATAAFTLAVESGLAAQEVAKALSTFEGVKRRFERVYESESMNYIDDYAHHPTEINAAISAARQFYPKTELTVVFQPHLFSRTKDFMDGFAEELSKADRLVLMDIYPARELPMEGITSAALLEKITLDHKQLLTPNEVLDFVTNDKPALLMTLGAGDIDRLVLPILNRYQS